MLGAAARTAFTKAPETVVKVAVSFFAIRQLVPKKVQVSLTYHFFVFAVALPCFYLNVELREFEAIVQFKGHSKNVRNY